MDCGGGTVLVKQCAAETGFMQHAATVSKPVARGKMH